MAEIPRPYLQFLSVLIVNRHDHLHVLVCGLVSFVEIPLNQSHVDVVAYVTFWGEEGVGDSFRHSKSLRPKHPKVHAFIHLFS